MEKRHPLICECAVCNAARKASAKKDVPVLIGCFILWIAVVGILRALGG